MRRRLVTCMLVKEADKNISIHFLNSKEGNDSSVVSKIKNIIVDEQVDIVHVHNWGVFVESVIAAKLAKAKKSFILFMAPILVTLILYLQKSRKNYATLLNADFQNLWIGMSLFQIQSSVMWLMK